MHRCLEIREIVARIAFFLPRSSCTALTRSDDPLAGYRRAGPDVLALALTTKHFLDPALDELWFRMDTLLLIARIALGFTHLSIAQWDLALCRKTLKEGRPIVNEANLRRFEYYASCIKYLELDLAGPQECLPDTFFQTLLVVRAPFPALQYLRWFHSSDRSHHHRFLPSFGGPALKTLVIAAFALPVSQSDSVNSAVKLLGAKSPSLRTLEISWGENPIYDQSYHQQASQFIINTQSLHVVKTSYSLTSRALLHLSKMSGVHTLQLSIDKESVFSDILYLPALRELTVISTRSADCARFLRAVRSPMVQNFKLLYLDCLPSSALQILCVALVQHISTATLQKLAILPMTRSKGRTHKCDCEHDENPVHPHDSISLFLSYNNLVDVKLWPCSMYLNDSIIEDAAKAWPQLCKLYIPPIRSIRGHPSKPTMRAIYAIAKWCPLIHYINLDIQPPTSRLEVELLCVDCSMESSLARERSQIAGDTRGVVMIVFERALGDRTRVPPLKTLMDAWVLVALLGIFDTFTPFSRIIQPTASDAEVMFMFGRDTKLYPKNWSMRHHRPP